jgi:hypothetical protein
MARLSASLVVFLTAAVGAAGAQTVAAKPVLQLVQRSPLKVQGSHFKARERVRLTATSTSGSAVVTARTTRLGQVVATFSNFSAPICDGLTVTAVGTRGDRATLVVSPPPPALPTPCPA